jgi:hypothetical protein
LRHPPGKLPVWIRSSTPYSRIQSMPDVLGPINVVTSKPIFDSSGTEIDACRSAPPNVDDGWR